MKLVVQGDHRVNLLIPPAHVPLCAALDIGMQALVRPMRPLVETAVNRNDHHVALEIIRLQLVEVLRQLTQGVEALAVHVEAVPEARQPPHPLLPGTAAVALYAAACAPGLEVPPYVSLGSAVKPNRIGDYRP